MHPFAFERLIVVQHHTVQPQDDHAGFSAQKLGDEPVAQQLAKLRQMMLAKGHENRFTACEESIWPGSVLNSPRRGPASFFK